MKQGNNQRIPDKKSQIRKSNKLTRPARLEGVVKEAMMQSVKKKKRVVPRATAPTGQRDYTEQQRKDYQLRSKKH